MREFLQAAAGLGMIRLVLDLALPEGESGKYADLGVGLMMMALMLRALFALIRGTG